MFGRRFDSAHLHKKSSRISESFFCGDIPPCTPFGGLRGVPLRLPESLRSDICSVVTESRCEGLEKVRRIDAQEIFRFHTTVTHNKRKVWPELSLELSKSFIAVVTITLHLNSN